MGNYQAPINTDGEPDMSPGPNEPASMSNTSRPLLNHDLGGEERDMSPGPSEAPLDQRNVTAPTYNKDQTNESLSILGAGQPYKSNN